MNQRRDHKSMPQEFRAFWSGPPLTAYEELSLKSITLRGHRVQLYSYDRSLRVPSGVELVPAGEILPGPLREFVYPNGDRTAALHSDLFRYEVLRKLGGWYFDLDVVLLNDQLPSTDIFLARQDYLFANGAVMKFPLAAPVLTAAVEAARSLTDHSEWGAIGPQLLTRLIKEHGLGHTLRPRSEAFPIEPLDVSLFFMPEHRESLEAQVADAYFVHLWHEIWRRARIPKGYGPPEGSYLDSLFRRFDIPMAPEARLSARAVESWFREARLVEAVKKLYGENFHAPDLKTRIEEALEERQGMLQSKSWRMTAPVRRLVDAVRKGTVAARRNRSAERS